MSWLSGMRWDAWELVGLIGEGLFFARMMAQWAASEKERRPVIPTIYWYMSLIGAVILVAYALHIGSFAVLLPQVVGLVFYTRGLCLDMTAKQYDAWRASAGFDKPGYAWPAISVVVPAHNEEKVLGAILEDLLGQDYPGEKPEILAALNGCTDQSAEIARRYPVQVVESPASGISFGKNLGGRAATGELIVFIDADNRVPRNALRLIAESAAGKGAHVGAVPGAPDRGGGVVRVCFWLANLVTRRRRAQAPSGVVFVDRATYDAVGGFDEKLPQGTSTDFIWRCIEKGAEYLFVDRLKIVTSIRRFEKKGVVWQMLSWRRNHQALAKGRREVVEGRPYEDFR